MRIKQIKHQYVGSGKVEFFVDIKGCKVILLTAKFSDGRDLFNLYKLAQQELSALDAAILGLAA